MSRWELPKENDFSCVSAHRCMGPSSWSESSGEIFWALDLFLPSFLYFSLLNPSPKFRLDSFKFTGLWSSTCSWGFFSGSPYTAQIKCSFQDRSVSACESGFRFPVIANPHDRERLNGVLSNGMIKQCRGRRKLGMSQSLTGPVQSQGHQWEGDIWSEIPDT